MGSNCSSLIDVKRCEADFKVAIFNTLGNGLIIVAYSWLLVRVILKTNLTMLAVIIALMIASLISIVCY